jgi:hypothetical protein
MKLLPLLLLLLLLPIVGQAQFAYTTNGDAITITGYTGPGGAVVVPNTLNGFPVSSIGDWAFYATSVTNVLIPDNVTSIGDGAFFDCESLTNVTLGSGVTNIGDWAFGFCTNLASICCRGNSPNLGDENVFYACPASIYFVEGTTGWDISLGGRPVIFSYSPGLFTYTKNSDGITFAITGYSDFDTDITIPSSINFLPVTAIGDGAFAGRTTLTGVTIPSSVNNIGKEAFASCVNLTDLAIPDSVTNIGDEAFFECESLTNVVIGNSVAAIGDWAFGSCPSLVRVCCRGNAPNLGGTNAFSGDLSTIFYLPGASGWGPTFDNQPAILWNPSVPYNYVTNSDEATLTITGYTGSDGGVNIPGGINFLPVTDIGVGAFASSLDLTNAVIPNTVASIEWGAFSSSTNLISVTIPNSVTSIGELAFAECSSLTGVKIPDSVTNLEPLVFSYCTSLTSISLPNSITVVEEGEFGNCANLTSVTIPNSVTNIGPTAFSYCINLAQVIIPEGVTAIEDYAFFDCAKLNNVTLPDTLADIGMGAFYNCTSVANIVIPNSVTYLAQEVFAGCTSLTNVVLSDNLTSLGPSLFGGCTNLTTITIPSNVVALYGPFADCPKLKELFFEGNAPPAVPINVTLYYLPGTTGWDIISEQTDDPTLPWLPQMQTTGTGYGTNAFTFDINWASGQTVVVEACTNLSKPNWQPVQTNMLTSGTANFSDPQWTNYPNRFYRLRSP